MVIPYFHNHTWAELTRDERFFCAILYMHASKDPAGFARWVIETSKLDISADGVWDVGFEVCFYRDMLWHMNTSAVTCKLPPKRTFDLCLFGERDIVVIEAKVFEPFDAGQNEDFEKDKAFIRQVPGMTKVTPHVIALASSKYFKNSVVYGHEGTLKVFEGKHVTWLQAAAQYGNDSLLARADELYKLNVRELPKYQPHDNA